ncbi:putative protein OS=Afipia felis OX=1035 GN=NCTC12722_02260 PE=4 SV=1 [Afipia felis]
MKTGRIGKKDFQQRLMISAQAHCAPVSHSPCEHFDHVFRLRPAIDIIADINLDSTRDRTPGKIVLDPLNHIVQEICAAVDISDGINPGLGWTGRV